MEGQKTATKLVHKLKHVERTDHGKKYECSCGRSFGSYQIWEEHAMDANAGFAGELESDMSDFEGLFR